MSTEPKELEIELEVDEADAVELDELTALLRRELLQLEVDAVDRRFEGEPPPGSRAIEVAALGALIVKLVATPETLRSVAETVQRWLAGRRDRKIKVEMDGDVLEVSGISAEDQKRLIDTWISRHAEG